MSITIEIPEALRQSLSTGGQSADQTVREAAAVELYRMGRMTAAQVAAFLGIPRVVVDGVLKAHGVNLEQSAADIEREASALSELRFSDDANLVDMVRHRVERGRDDVKAGRVYTTEQVRGTLSK